MKFYYIIFFVLYSLFSRNAVFCASSVVICHRNYISLSLWITDNGIRLLWLTRRYYKTHNTSTDIGWNAIGNLIFLRRVFAPQNCVSVIVFFFLFVVRGSQSFVVVREGNEILVGIFRVCPNIESSTLRTMQWISRRLNDKKWAPNKMERKLDLISFIDGIHNHCTRSP